MIITLVFLLWLALSSAAPPSSQVFSSAWTDRDCRCTNLKSNQIMRYKSTSFNYQISFKRISIWILKINHKQLLICWRDACRSRIWKEGPSYRQVWWQISYRRNWCFVSQTKESLHEAPIYCLARRYSNLAQWLQATVQNLSCSARKSFISILWNIYNTWSSIFFNI